MNTREKIYARNRLATLRLVLVMSVDDSTRRETIKLLADR